MDKESPVHIVLLKVIKQFLITVSQMLYFCSVVNPNRFTVMKKIKMMIKNVGILNSSLHLRKQEGKILNYE